MSDDKFNHVKIWELAKIAYAASTIGHLAVGVGVMSQVSTNTIDVNKLGDANYRIKLMEERVGHLSKSIHYDDPSQDVNNFTPEHAKNVLSVINAALEIAEKWAKPGNDVQHNRRAQLGFALGLIIEFRETHNTQDITFRDADHYFAGRLQEWQNRLERVDRRTRDPNEEPSELLSYLSPLATSTYDYLKNLGFDMRSNPNHPAAPPGNRYWADLGDQHFRKYDVDGDKKVIVEKPTESDVIQAAKKGERQFELEKLQEEYRIDSHSYMPK